MFLVFAFIAAELMVVLRVFSGYSRDRLNHLFDTKRGFIRLTLLLAAMFLPFLLFVIALFSPGNLERLISNPWFYFLLFVVCILFAVVAQEDILRIFGRRLSSPVRWFDGWTGLLRMYLLVCAVILPVVWLVLFLDASYPLVHKTAYANGLFMGELKTLLIVALGLTGYIRRHLAINDAISNATYVAVSGMYSQMPSGVATPADSKLPPHS